MKKLLLLTIIFLSGCGTVKPAPVAEQLGAGKKMGVPEWVNIGGQNYDKDIIVAELKSKRALGQQLNRDDVSKRDAVIQNHKEKCDNFAITDYSGSIPPSIDDLLDILEQGC